jgi:hypothetical protein
MYQFWNFNNVYVWFINTFGFVVLSSLSWASVASNPFLRPGSNRPPPQETPPPPSTPQPKIDPAFSKEVEFRGYFLLKGIPHFCIFNKKSNFGEWIKLTEKTEEDFVAQAFDLESETLTLAFSGQTFDLNLINPTPSNSTASPNNSIGSTNQSTGSGTKTTGSQPKIMPPKPDRVPQLPRWLTSRMGNRLNSTADSTGRSSTPSSPSGIRSIPPRLPTFTSTRPPTGSPSTSATSVANSQSPTSVNQSVNVTGGTSPTVSNSENLPQVDLPDNQVSTSTIEDLDLEGLPPPPPPPNILPPGGPPNLIPSRDE